MDDASTALKTARFWQPLVCASLLAGIALSAAMLEAVVHDETIGVWMDRKWVEINETANEYARRAGRLAVPKALRRRNTAKNPAVYAADYKLRMGPDWRQGILSQRRELQDWLDYVRGRGMRFEIVLLPLASWHEPLPYPEAYRAMIAEFCKTNRVPLVDLSRLLADDDFLDHIHVNSRGLRKTDAALMGVARGFLKSTRAWPAR